MAEGATLAKQKELLGCSSRSGNPYKQRSRASSRLAHLRNYPLRKTDKKHDVEGLIHISEIAWEKVEDPGQYLKVGDSVKIKVIGVDPTTGKLDAFLKTASS